jgi:hypothetical protein
MQIPKGRQMEANHKLDAENAAAMAVPDSHFKKIRSANVITVQERLDTTSGIAT